LTIPSWTALVVVVNEATVKKQTNNHSTSGSKTTGMDDGWMDGSVGLGHKFSLGFSSNFSMGL
jgi:hypothetical protein